MLTKEIAYDIYNDPLLQSLLWERGEYYKLIEELEKHSGASDLINKYRQYVLQTMKEEEEIIARHFITNIPWL